MIDALVKAAGGYEKVSGYTKSLSECGKLTMIAGAVGVVASPILGNGLESVAVTALGYATWTLFEELAKDFHVVDVMIKIHFSNHQAWLEQKGLAHLDTARLSKITD
jgi:hypothetical protein